eukprot:824734-Rhodomonas_salina.1
MGNSAEVAQWAAHSGSRVPGIRAIVERLARDQTPVVSWQRPRLGQSRKRHVKCRGREKDSGQYPFPSDTT